MWNQVFEIIDLLTDAQQVYPRLLSLIRSATSSIRIRMYMWRDDTVGKSILDELARAIEERNIQVTIEKDAFGSLVFQLQKIMSFGRDGWDVFRGEYGRKFLRKYAQNITFFYINFFSFLRFKFFYESDHSKIYFFDENLPTAKILLGGMNIGDEYLSLDSPRATHDYMILLSGKEVFRHIIPCILKKKKSPIRHSDYRLISSALSKKRLRQSLLKSIRNARYSIIFEHGHLTSWVIVRELRKAARRWVRVTMILPKTPDKGTFDANVDAMRLLLKPFFGQKKAIPNMRIYAYPGRIHAKLALFDNNQFMIGSANLTNGSLHLFRETNMIFTHCPMLIAQVQDQLKADCAKSTLLTHRTLPPYRRWLAKIQRLFI